MQLNHPCIFVIFGGTGDLARKKLLPALFNLHVRGSVGSDFAVAAIGRRSMSSGEYAEWVKENVQSSLREPLDPAAWAAFTARLFYVCLDFSRGPSHFESLGSRLSDLDRRFHTFGNRVFCLAISPVLTKHVVQSLHRSGLIHNTGSWQRVMIEKPFGTDRRSAGMLNRSLTSYLPEERIFRVDHYLGKEMIQNILSLRFGNLLFESIWNKDHIDHIQITSAETIGVETRGAYYEQAGILRDMFQSHILQVLSLICMDPPDSMDTSSVVAGKVRVLRALKLAAAGTAGESDVVLGQYGPGSDNTGSLPGYREEMLVSKSSDTPTFVALKVFVNTPRWKGVPVYIRAGKRMDRKVFEIAIIFKNPRDFPRYPELQSALTNALIIRIQPCGEILVRINIKGSSVDEPVRSVLLDCSEKCFCRQNSPESYERLMDELLHNQHALFITWKELFQAWKFTERVEAAAGRFPVHFPNYPAGSAGPGAASLLIERDGRCWYDEKE